MLNTIKINIELNFMKVIINFILIINIKNGSIIFDFLGNNKLK